VWVLASTPLDGLTRRALDDMGPVKFIIAADDFHHMFIREYTQAYPQAKLIGTPRAVRKNTDMNFSGCWGQDTPGTQYGFEPEIQYRQFSGFITKDVAFYHSPSRSLIVPDLIFNLPPREQYSLSGTWFPFWLLLLNPFSIFHGFFTLFFGFMNPFAMRRDAKAVQEWDFERIIPCHGDVVEKNARKAWERAYRFYLF
jgi:hypothetical protein